MKEAAAAATGTIQKQATGSESSMEDTEEGGKERITYSLVTTQIYAGA